MNSKETGTAKIVVSLENGKIIVNHGYYTQHVLHERDADEGIWDALWNVIRNH